MRFAAPADLHALDAAALEELLGRSELLLVSGEGEIAGIGAAALLFADYAVLRDTASLRIDTPQAWAGAAWRLGRGALRLRLDDRTTFAAAEARARGCSRSESRREGWRRFGQKGDEQR